MADGVPGSGGRGGGGGLDDILSMALLQTGVESVTPTQIPMDSNSILNAAANTLDSSLLSTDIGVLTDGLFSTLGLVKENPVISKPHTVASNSGGATPVQPSTATNRESSGSNHVVAPSIVATQPSSVTVPATTSAVSGQSAMRGLEGPALPLIQPPSESEVKAAQLLKAELHSSCMNDDIDLDELFSGGDAVNADVGDISFLDSAVSTGPSIQTPSTGVPLPPPTSLGSLTNSTNTASGGDDLSSLLDAAGSQYLESLDPLSVGTCTSSSQQTLASTMVTTTSSAPSANVLAVASVNRSSSPSLPMKATATPLPMVPTTSTTPTPTPTPSTAPSTSITTPTKSTSTNSTLQLKKSALTTTKLDIAAILREVTKMSPASIAASTSSLTNTVSVTVVPSSAIQNVIRRTGAVKTQKIVSGVPLVARAPLMLQRYSIYNV